MEQKKEQDIDGTKNRFVAFFDIMGFKDRVARNPHKNILKDLKMLRETINDLESHNNSTKFAEILKTNVGTTRAITFSDSIAIFSKGDSLEDLNKILIDSYLLIDIALEGGIPIKGALSYGEITVDFNNSLFFGQPIIDAFTLHEDLQVYAIVLDNNIEKKIEALKLPEKISSLIYSYKTPFKGGKITHKILGGYGKKEIIQRQINDVKKINLNVSGNPRLYVDNTVDFLNFVLASFK